MKNFREQKGAFPAKGLDPVSCALWEWDPPLSLPSALCRCASLEIPSCGLLTLFLSPLPILLLAVQSVNLPHLFFDCEVLFDMCLACFLSPHPTFYQLDYSIHSIQTSRKSAAPTTRSHLKQNKLELK